MIKKISRKGLTNKEALSAFVNTLTDKQCREAYILMKEMFQSGRSKVLKFNKQGVVCDMGLVRLTQMQYDKLIVYLGEFRTQWQIEKLHTWLEDMRRRAENNPRDKATYRKYMTDTHYNYMVDNSLGWVYNAYTTALQTGEVREKSLNHINFNDIKNIDMAKKFIERIPKQNRLGNIEIDLLFQTYPKLEEMFNTEKE